jgi:hypothetical protein
MTGPPPERLEARARACGKQKNRCLAGYTERKKGEKGWRGPGLELVGSICLGQTAMHDSGQLPPIYDPTQRPPQSNLHGGGGLHGDDEDKTPEVTPRLLGLGIAVTLHGGGATLPDSPVMPTPVHSPAVAAPFQIPT